jgi:ribose transport system substrate-binding protein
MLSLGLISAAAAEVDYANLKAFKIENVPQEKLDTTLYMAVSIRGLENPYIATIKVGMEMFAKYLDTIGQKYEMQVLDSQGDNDKEVDNMRQFSAKAGGNAIAYSDPNENSIPTRWPSHGGVRRLHRQRLEQADDVGRRI